MAPLSLNPTSRQTPTTAHPPHPPILPTHASQNLDRYPPRHHSAQAPTEHRQDLPVALECQCFALATTHSHSANQRLPRPHRGPMNPGHTRQCPTAMRSAMRLAQRSRRQVARQRRLAPSRSLQNPARARWRELARSPRPRTRCAPREAQPPRQTQLHTRSPQKKPMTPAIKKPMGSPRYSPISMPSNAMESQA